MVHETRTRGNDIHLPISLAYAERLCRAYPGADAELVRVATVLHDTGWAHVDESRIISEGFTGDWRKAAIRYEHEQQGCDVARRVLPALGYSTEFIERVCEIIDNIFSESQLREIFEPWAADLQYTLGAKFYWIKYRVK